jgi:hypothetical protein
MIGNYIKAGGGGPLFPIDADAQAFITAAGITDNTQQNAINILVTSMKDYGIWGKMDAVYPFVGGTAFSHKFNLKNPADTNAAFRLNFLGGWTHNANGVTPNGTNGYAETFYNLSTNALLNDISNGVYCRTNSIVNSVSYGGENSSFVGSVLLLKAADNNTYYSVNDNLGLGAANIISDTRGFFINNRIPTGKQIVRNITQAGVINSAATSLVNFNIVFGANNRGGLIQNYCDRNYSFFFLGKTLINTEIGVFAQIVQLYQRILGRQV